MILATFYIMLPVAIIAIGAALVAKNLDALFGRIGGHWEFLAAVILVPLVTALPNVLLVLLGGDVIDPNLLMVNQFGNNLFNLTVVVAIIALTGLGFKKQVWTGDERVHQSILLLLLIAVPLVLYLTVRGDLSFIIISICLATHVLVYLLLIIRGLNNQKLKNSDLEESPDAGLSAPDDKKPSLAGQILFLIFSMAIVVLGGYLLDQALNSAQFIQLSFSNKPYFFYGVVLAGITILPELLLGVFSIKFDRFTFSMEAQVVDSLWSLILALFVVMKVKFSIHRITLHYGWWMIAAMLVCWLCFFLNNKRKVYDVTLTEALLLGAVGAGFIVVVYQL